MPGVLRIVFAAILAVHGLVHLIGTAVYFQFTEMAEFPYKTTVLGGYWNLGTTGIQVFGLLWAAAAIGFWVAAGALLRASGAGHSILLAVTLLSLVLTTLDWTVAYAGIIVNLGILTALLLVPRL